MQQKQFNILMDAAESGILALQQAVGESGMSRAEVEPMVVVWVNARPQFKGLTPYESRKGGMTFGEATKVAKAATQMVRDKMSLIFNHGIPKVPNKNAETDPVAKAIQVCSKLSWADWARVVKAIEATR